MFPSEAMMRTRRGLLHTLVGFQNRQSGGGYFFNFILSNGARSTQRDKSYPTDHTFMIPADAINRIRSVTIYYTHCIRSFFFFDKDGKKLYKIGDTCYDHEKKTVVLAENEVIVGVVAKLYPTSQTVYTDF